MAEKKLTEAQTVEPWPIDQDGKPKLFTALTKDERQRLMYAKSVSIRAALAGGPRHGE